MLFAEHTFRQSRKVETGGTQGEHAESAKRQLANLDGGKSKLAEKLETAGPPMPWQLSYLWQDFCELSMGLPQNGMGPPVVTWEAMHAWCEFSGIALEPWEARTLIILGQKRAAIQSEDIGKKDKA